uniref:Putative secreted protein n=1 Tax=Ixodes ricinus TaxID=34613 RepID=A0A6B0UZH8_IXORI
MLFISFGLYLARVVSTVLVGGSKMTLTSLGCWSSASLLWSWTAECIVYGMEDMACASANGSAGPWVWMWIGLEAAALYSKDLSFDLGGCRCADNTLRRPAAQGHGVHGSFTGMGYRRKRGTVDDITTAGSAEHFVATMERTKRRLSRKRVAYRLGRRSQSRHANTEMISEEAKLARSDNG